MGLRFPLTKTNCTFIKTESHYARVFCLFIFVAYYKIKLVLHVQLLQSCLTVCGPWTVADQGPLSMEFFRQEYWSGFSFPSPGDLPESRD